MIKKRFRLPSGAEELCRAGTFSPSCWVWSPCVELRLLALPCCNQLPRARPLGLCPQGGFGLPARRTSAVLCGYTVGMQIQTPLRVQSALPYEGKEMPISSYRLMGTTPVGDCFDQSCQVPDTPAGCNSMGKKGEQLRAGTFRVETLRGYHLGLGRSAQCLPVDWVGIIPSGRLF